MVGNETNSSATYCCQQVDGCFKQRNGLIDFECGCLLAKINQQLTLLPSGYTGTDYFQQMFLRAHCLFQSRPLKKTHVHAGFAKRATKKMNIFRLTADMSHLLAILLLLLKMQRTKSCGGISFYSQAMFATVFLTRYVDLFWNFHSLYNSVMKIFFISSSLYSCYLVFWRFRATRDVANDVVRPEYLLIPCALLSLVANYEFIFVEIIWSFSIWLEAVAILPQLFMLQKSGEGDNITAHYLFALGAYRGLYIINWIYRYYTEGYIDWIAWVGGTIQTLLYADFFYIYVTKVLRGQKFELPK